MIRGYSSLVRSAGVSAPRSDARIILFNSFYWCLCQTISSVPSRVTPPGCTCCRNLNQLAFLKVRSRVTPRCPRRDCIGTAGQTDTIVGLVLARGRDMPCSTKVELYGAHARQGKETVHLVGNRRELVGRQGRWSPALVMRVGLAVVVVRDSLK